MAGCGQQCGPRYLSLCSIPKLLMRDGYGGPNAHIYVPFCGFIFASGVTYTFPGSTVAQDMSHTVAGISKPNTFSKNNCECC